MPRLLVLSVLLLATACSKAPDPPATATQGGCARGPRRRRGAGRDRLGEGRRRRRVRQGQGREQARIPVLGRRLVPAVQPGEGDALQPPGLHRALAPLRAGLPRRRQQERAAAGRALQDRRLSDDDPVHPRRHRDHAPARRGRRRAVHAGAGPRDGRRAPGEGHAGRSPRQGRRRGAAALGRRLADARVLLVGHRRAGAHSQKRPRRDPAPARAGLPARGDRHRGAAQAEGAGRRGQGAGRQAAPTTRPRATSWRRCWRIRRSSARASTSSPATRARSPGTSALPKSDGRAALVAAWDAVLVRLAADASLSAADRLSAVGGRIDLARLDAGDAQASRAAACQRARGRCPRRQGDDEPLRPRDGDQRRRVRAGVGGPSRRIGRAAHCRARALEHAVLRDARPREQRQEARRQGGRGRLGREGLRSGHRPGDAAAVGRELRRHARRPDAGGHRPDREGRRPGDRRARARPRHLLRPQPPLPRADGEEARRLEQGQGAPGRREAAQDPARRRLRQAARRRSGARVLRRRLESGEGRRCHRRVGRMPRRRRCGSPLQRRCGPIGPPASHPDHAADAVIPRRRRRLRPSGGRFGRIVVAASLARDYVESLRKARSGSGPLRSHPAEAP